MDGNRFDDLGRILGGQDSRRGVVRLLAGTAIGALFGGAAADTSAKAKRCPQKPCPTGFIRNKRTCKCECKRTSCRGGMEFDLKSCRCKCPSEMRECKDGCIGKDECCPGDPPCPEDPKGCCHAPGLDVCTIDGCCRELDGLKACNNFCVDTNTNRNHCGGCDNECRPEEVCVAGECTPNNQCPTGTKPCPGRLGGSFCAPGGNACCGDASCGGTDVCCDASQDICCVRGACVEGRCCTGNRKVCNDRCVDTQTDRLHCGSCDGWCNGPGLECCSGSCKTLMTDEANCGACGHTCDQRTERCVDGQCRDICSLNAPGWQNRCDDGFDYWCCPDGSTQCCRLSGQPHCC
ncbi:MAG: hypothetical protein U0031_06840 [Thermomicrobiales bacterium]